MSTSALSPEAVQLRRKLSAVYTLQHKPAKAQKLFDGLIHLYSGDGSSRDDLANALSHQAKYFYDVAEYDRAAQSLQTALNLRQSHPDNRMLVGKTLENLQQVLEKAGKAEQITSLFAETRDGNKIAWNTEVGTKRAVIFTRAKKLEEAEEELLKVIASTKGKARGEFAFSNLKYCLAQLYALHNKNLEAINILNGLFEDYLKSTITARLVSFAEMPADLQKSVDDWHKDAWGIVRMNADSSFTSTHCLAALYTKENQFGKASDVLTRTLANKGDEQASYQFKYYYNELAYTLMHENKFEQARKALGRAIKLAQPEQGTELLALKGNKALLKEKSKIDASPALKEIIETIPRLALNGEGPIPDFGQPNDQQSMCPDANLYKSTNGQERIDPVIDFSAPRLILLRNGMLAATDNALFPGQPYRSEFRRFGQAGELCCIDWNFNFSGETAERLKTLALVRLGDIYRKEQKTELAYAQYALALQSAQSEKAGKDCLQIVAEHKKQLDVHIFEH